MILGDGDRVATAYGSAVMSDPNVAIGDGSPLTTVAV